MNIIQVSVDDLKPYKNNPRYNDDAVEYVANSIREFGFKVPIVIDKNNVIVTGHTRLKAALELGLDTVPCIVADDLTDEQVKAFRLADNKVSEMAAWDFEKLDLELDGILDFDMEDFGFEFEEEDFSPDPPNERERTYNEYNLGDFQPTRCEGFYQMPVIQKCMYLPKDVISFNYVLNTDAFDKGVHFYIDDYQFERIWNEPYRYMERLKQFDCVLTPDFSLYMEMPIAMQIWNVYRSRLIGQIMQDFGMVVIPTLSWSNEDSFEFCFDGLEKNGSVSVSTVGVKHTQAAIDVWYRGMEEAMKRLEPKKILVYGGDVGFDYGDDVEVRYIGNHNTERIKKKDTNTG